MGTKIGAKISFCSVYTELLEKSMKNRKCATLGVYTGEALIYKVRRSFARRKTGKGHRDALWSSLDGPFFGQGSTQRPIEESCRSVWLKKHPETHP
jgi:hypothetical protein